MCNVMHIEYGISLVKCLPARIIWITTRKFQQWTHCKNRLHVLSYTYYIYFLYTGTMDAVPATYFISKLKEKNICLLKKSEKWIFCWYFRLRQFFFFLLKKGFRDRACELVVTQSTWFFRLIFIFLWHMRLTQKRHNGF